MPHGMTWVVGITWLAIPFGAYFGLKLARAGEGPLRPWRALAWPAAGVAAVVVGLRAVGQPGAGGASRPLVRPLAADRYEIRFTASAETRDYVRRAQDLLGHAIPSGDLDQVFNRALRLLVRELERKKFAATERPRWSRGQPR